MPGDADAPPEDPADRHGGQGSGRPPRFRAAGASGYGRRASDDDFFDDLWGAAPAWPPLPVTIGQISPAFGRPRAAAPPDAHPDESSPEEAALERWRAPDTPTRPPPDVLRDLTITWPALLGASCTAARIGRLGPVTAALGRRLALIAAFDPSAAWRVIVPDGSGRRAGSRRAGSPALPGGLARPPAGSVRPGHRASTRLAADMTATGGCAHTTAAPAYQAPPRMRELVQARDQTCRHPRCRQRGWHADLEHTTPHDRSGLTCPCNLAVKCKL